MKLYRSKRYAPEELYKAESEAFIHLRNSHALGKNFIGYYGSFTHGNTRNILLEYADYGSLDNFFNSVDPPSTGEDIIRFWQSMFGVIDAVCKIHTIPSPESHNAAPLFNGFVLLIFVAVRANLFFSSWHQDIKPENVLVSSGPVDGEFEFKLADLGLAHFHKVKAKSNSYHNGAVSGRDVGGTREYGESYDDTTTSTTLKEEQVLLSAIVATNLNTRQLAVSVKLLTSGPSVASIANLLTGLPKARWAFKSTGIAVKK